MSEILLSEITVLLRPSLRALLLSATLLTASVTATARDTSGMGRLTHQIQSGDFRVQVQAALLLGKTGDGRALAALTRALKDESVAVRTAAAAALQTLGDPAALPALRASAEDAHAAVRRRVAATVRSLDELRQKQSLSRKKAKLLVKLSGFRSDANGGSLEAIGDAAQTSRKLLEQIPQVAVLNASEEPEAAAALHGRPVIVMRPKLSHLSSKKQGADTVVVANVEFLIEAWPEYNIVGQFSGNASAQSEASSGAEQVKLQEAAVDAAVSSALRRGTSALLSVVGQS